jgi:hypothetical protein
MVPFLTHWGQASLRRNDTTYTVIIKHKTQKTSDDNKTSFFLFPPSPTQKKKKEIPQQMTRTVYKASLTTVGSITLPGSITFRSYFTRNVRSSRALSALSFLHPSYSRLFMAVIGPYKVEKGGGTMPFWAIQEGDSECSLIFLAMLSPSFLHLQVLFISCNVHSLCSKWLHVISTKVICSKVGAVTTITVSLIYGIISRKQNFWK